MEDMFGYLASLLIGLSLGLIGGGGSILTLPVLVFLFRVNPLTATAYSLFIVGSTSLVGALPKYRQGLVNTRAALAFGLPSIAAVFLMRIWVVPHIPLAVAVGQTIFSSEVLLMVLFAALMIAASLSLINPKKQACPNAGAPLNLPLVITSGLLEGALTGIVGAGGGFLIIPALVLLHHLPMKEAIGTSLLIIAAKSLIGFTGDLGHFDMNWRLLAPVTGLAITGIFIGNQLSKRVNGEQLKKGFGWFVLLMGVYVLIRTLYFA